MATDATGTPTSPDSIPTYNTAVDAPSGDGFNAAMAAIQTALSARTSKPSGIASGEVPVWNGSAWVRSSVTNVGATSLGSGTPDATKYLRGDATWQTLGVWASYTPTWTTTGVAPALGNGSLTGRYVQIGKWVHGIATLVAGTTTTFGTGDFEFSLPVTASASAGSMVGVGSTTNSGVATYVIFSHLTTSAKVNIYTTASPTTVVSGTVPFAFGTADDVYVTFKYEAA